MLAFHFIDSRHVAIPVYTRLFSIKSAAKHLAGYTWGIIYIYVYIQFIFGIYINHVVETLETHKCDLGDNN